MQQTNKQTETTNLFTEHSECPQSKQMLCLKLKSTDQSTLQMSSARMTEGSRETKITHSH